MIKFISCIAITFLASCASTYKPLRPNSTFYGNKEESGGVTFSYKHGVLAETGNKKYSKREVEKAIKIVSVKITNNTNDNLVIGENAKFYSGSNELRLIDPHALHGQLKQGVPIYLLYLLMSFSQISTSNSNGTVNHTPIGLVIGPGLAIGNMVVAGTANQNFLRELNEFNLINKTISPGQTAYGLIGITDIGYNPVRLVVTK